VLVLNGDPDHTSYQRPSNIKKKYKKNKQDYLVQWHKPHDVYVKLNFDGSLIRNNAAGEFLVRNWKGELPQVGASNFGNTSIIVAEALALRLGHREVIKDGYKHIQIERDSKIIIGAIKGKIQAPWQLDFIIKDIKTLM